NVDESVFERHKVIAGIPFSDSRPTATIHLTVSACNAVRRGAGRRHCRASTFPKPLQSFFGELEGAEDGAGFVLAFLVFAGGDGVGDDAGAELRANCYRRPISVHHSEFIILR